eukprot:792947-Alexandrium_andersonii.AAC.1
MSASLVGSEMCIRDSCDAERVRCAAIKAARAAFAAFEVTGDLGDGAGAVSYTHLTLPTICSV